MATTEWIASAAHEAKPTPFNGIETMAHHILNLARADEKREARDRVLAGQAVRRIAGGGADELLAMLGLDGTPPPACKPKPRLHHGAVAEKECLDCGETKPAAEFVRRPRHADGLESYCRACGRERKREWMRRRRAGRGVTS